jgi:hypothetical protein
VFGAHSRGVWNNLEDSGFMSVGVQERQLIYQTPSNIALPYTVQQGAIIHGNTFRRNLGSTLNGTLFSKIYLNENFTTPVFTLSLDGTRFVQTDDYNSVKVNKNDRIYVELSGSTGLSQTDLHSVVLDFGLF